MHACPGSPRFRSAAVFLTEAGKAPLVKAAQLSLYLLSGPSIKWLLSFQISAGSENEKDSFLIRWDDEKFLLTFFFSLSYSCWSRVGWSWMSDKGKEWSRFEPFWYVFCMKYEWVWARIGPRRWGHNTFTALHTYKTTSTVTRINRIPCYRNEVLIKSLFPGLIESRLNHFYANLQ